MSLPLITMSNGYARFAAIGGYNGLERLNTVEILDGNKRMWSRVGSMSCKRSAVGAAALQDRLYVS